MEIPSPINQEQILFGYHVCSRIGSGAFGTVLLAFDDQEKRPLALKIPKGEVTPKIVDAAITELLSMRRLDHPNIVKIYDARFVAGETYLASEFIDGLTLTEYRQKDGGMDAEEAMRICWAVANALHYSHQQGVLHRDVKPSNIVVDTTGKPYLTDFGLALLFDDDYLGSIAGTPRYMSPEQLRGEVIDARSDVYSLGMILFELLTGEVPFIQDSSKAIRKEHYSRLLPNLGEIKPELPSELWQVCEKATAQNRTNRYSTAEEFADAMASILGPEGIPQHVDLPRRTKKFKNYYCCAILGKGSFGTVYLAFDDKAKRPVSLKLPEQELTPQVIDVALTEVRSMTRLDHPNIVKIFDADFESNQIFLALEYIDGLDLSEHLQANPTASLTEKLTIVETVARALHFAHEKGIIHRDVKPQNILVDQTGVPYLTDFGLAFALDEGKSEVISGTPRYMSPEQLRGEKLDATTDIYSLGLVMYEILSGIAPYATEASDSPAITTASASLRNLRSENHEIPERIASICHKAISPLQDRRFESADDFARAIEEALVALNSDQPTLLEQSHSGVVVEDAVLKGVGGPHKDDLIRLEKSSYVLGRHPECDIQIDSSSVSRKHAELKNVKGVWILQDLGSRNGTMVNREMITSPRPLKPGDYLDICDCQFEFLSESSPQYSSMPTATFVDDSGNSSVMSRFDIRSALRSQSSPDTKLAAITELATSLSGKIEKNQLLERFLDSLFKIFVQAERGFVLLQDARGRLVPSVFRLPDAEKNQPFKLSRTILTNAIESKQAVLSADAMSDERFDMSQSIADFRIRSIMIAPLISNQKTLGVIQLDSTDVAKRFRPEDLELLAAVATYAAAFIENAQIFEKLIDSERESRDLAIWAIHNIRQPLTALEISLKGVQRKHFGPTSNDPSALENSFGHLNRAKETVEEILDLVVRSEAIQFDDTDLENVELKQVVAACQKTFETSEINFETEIAEGLEFKGHRQLMIQAFEQLVYNSRNFKLDATVRFCGQLVEVDSSQIVQIQIVDNGPGIPPEHIEQIFDKGFTSSGKGRGLGLAIVKRIIEKHRGRIAYQPEKSGGAGFVIDIPVNVDNIEVVYNQ